MFRKRRGVSGKISTERMHGGLIGRQVLSIFVYASCSSVILTHAVDVGESASKPIRVAELRS